MTMVFPALLLGGPPHSGKSTLLYRLSQALRLAHVEHYALRASPDGEGDWTHEATESLVRELRMRSKDDWTPSFAARISRDIDQRHLPLLVDVGGRVTPETTQVAAACTHGLLIAPLGGDLAPWRAQLGRLGRPLVAELRSDLHGVQQVSDDGSVLRGTLSGLGRGLTSDGLCLEALVARVRRLFDYPPDQLYHIHRSLAPVEFILHLEYALPPLLAHSGDRRWEPAELPVLLGSLPADEPLALYGRGPMWLYGALGAFTRPIPQLFNPRAGWVAPPDLQAAAAPDPLRLRWDALETHTDHTRLCLSIPGGHLDLAEASGLPIPQAPAGHGVVLDGKLPNWLFVALARAYRAAPWLAIYQAGVGDIVVVSQTPELPVGTLRQPTRLTDAP
ncbi:MAG: hypothetical protein HGA45_09480 [Chloroflexales bacterium]|nr:hypothetical protein [Chloroflexales bacterium]